MRLGFTPFGLLLAACSSTTVVPPPAAVDAGAADASTPDLTCPTFGAPAVLGTMSAAELDEISGIAASRVNPGVYWVHNDSGDVARTFAIGSDEKLLATLRFDTAMPTDIEDMAIEDSDSGSFLYLGDIGDNASVRTSVTIHRVAEPVLDGTATLTAVSETMTVKYPDGAHNAETLLFEPNAKELFIVTKVEGGPSAVHRVGPFAAGTAVTTTKIAEIDINLATSGEISRDGRYVVIRNYSPTALVWPRTPGEDLATVLARVPCGAPVATETQGEAIAFQVGNTGFVTTSEGLNQKVSVTTLSP